jgi:hypothetical protein
MSRVETKFGNLHHVDMSDRVYSTKDEHEHHVRKPHHAAFGAFGYEEIGKGHGQWNRAISAFQTGLEITAKVALVFLVLALV